MRDLFSGSDPSKLAPPDAAERRALIALSLVPGVGAGRFQALRQAFGSARAVLKASADRLVRVDGVGPRTARAIRDWDEPAAVDDQLDRAERIGAALVALGDATYPPLLARIYDPPPFLWVRGRLDPADDLAVAVVGTRKATEAGRRVAEAFARDFAKAGVTVVSGLAYGIDIAAHRATLAAGGRTVAVLGSGVDRIYPSRHRPTVRQILHDDAGAVVSEFPLGAAPDAANFPRRNRIIAGLSLATVVAEARETGGALLTGALALEQNREVFAVPATVFSESVGTNRMIQRGLGALAVDAADVLEAVAPQTERAVPVPEAAPPDLTAVERALLDALGPEPLGLDAVCAAADVDASTALVYLLQLEFRGLVRQMSGKQFYRA